MFERFSATAREVVLRAREDARNGGADAVRGEHLLLGLLSTPGSLALEVLATCSVSAADLTADLMAALGPSAPSYAEALTSIGIDLDEVRRQAEESFGPGALDRTRAARGAPPPGRIRFDRSAKRVLELALREAVDLGQGHLGGEHLLLGLLRAEGVPHEILRRRGVDLTTVRGLVVELTRGRRTG